MEVVNDFLSNEQFSELSYWLCGSDIAWFFNPNIAIETEEKSLNCYFTHMFYGKTSLWQFAFKHI